MRCAICNEVMIVGGLKLAHDAGVNGGYDGCNVCKQVWDRYTGELVVNGWSEFVAGDTAIRGAGRPAELVNAIKHTISLGDNERALIAKILAARPDLADSSGRGMANAVRWALGVAAAALESAE
jgi:hypothetical protein